MSPAMTRHLPCQVSSDPCPCHWHCWATDGARVSVSSLITDLPRNSDPSDHNNPLLNNYTACLTHNQAPAYNNVLPVCQELQLTPAIITRMLAKLNLLCNNQLEKLEAAKAAYLWFPLVTFSYPWLLVTLCNLMLPLVTFPYLTLPYLSLPFLTLFCICLAD